MAVSSRIADASHFQRDPLWPLRMVRAATFGEAPFSTATLSDIVSMLEDYDGQMRRHGYSTDVFARADEALNAGTAPASLKKLVSSLYEEGVEMAKVFGDDMATLKAATPDAAALSRELKTFKSVENLVGFHHVREFFTAAQRQAQLSLLHEEGLIPKEKFDAGIAAITDSLKRGGHYGVHSAIEAHPSLNEAILKDARPIVVDYAKGRKTAGVASISNYSRAAYVRSEMAHAATLAAHGPEYMESSLNHAMGADYIQAHRNKWHQAHELTGRYSALAGEIEVPNATLKATMQDAATAGPKRMLEARRAFVGKHGLALLDPRTVELLHSSGKYDERFWQSLDEGMHTVMGGSSPFAPHVRERAEGKAGHKRTGVSGGGKAAIEHRDGGDAQKKTPEGGRAGSGSASTSSNTAETRPVEARGTTPKEVSRMASAGEGGGAKHTVGRWASSGLFGLMLFDGLSNLRQSKKVGKDVDQEAPPPISFARVLEVSVGAVGLAASWMLKDSTIAKTMSRL